MSFDDIYRPPGRDPSANHSAFSHDEWRYMARVFAAWIVGTSIFVGIALTIQTSYALRAFSAAGGNGGIVAVSALREIAPLVVIFAASNTMVFAIEQRTRKHVPPPSDHWHWSALAWLYAAVPIVSVIILGSSLATNTIGYNGAYDRFWASIQHTVAVQDFPYGLVSFSCQITFLGVIAPRLMRCLSRQEGWLLLKYVAMWLLCCAVAGTVGGILVSLRVFFQ
jgi:hypothetical protein